MTNDLTKYDAACRAIAEAASVDEVKNIHDWAKAMAAYARQAKDRTAEAHLAAIRMRSTRRIGEMMHEQKRTIGLNRGAADSTRVIEKPTLASQGIDKNLAHQARTLSNLPPEKFEERVAEARDAALGVVDKVVRRQAHADRKEERAQIDANPTAFEQAQKANKARSKAAALSRMAPTTLDGWRRGYLNAVKHLAPDIGDEHQLIWDAFQDLMGERDKQRRGA